MLTWPGIMAMTECGALWHIGLVVHFAQQTTQLAPLSSSQNIFSSRKLWTLKSARPTSAAPSAPGLGRALRDWRVSYHI